MNLISKCIVMGGLVLFSGAVLASGPSNVQICLSATNYVTQSNWGPQQFKFILENKSGDSQAAYITLQTPSAYMEVGANIVSPSSATVQSSGFSCSLENIPSDTHWIETVVDYAGTDHPTTCKTMAAYPTQPADSRCK